MAHLNEVKAIIERLLEQGWRVRGGNKHYVCYPPNKNKRIVTISSTPSGQNATKMIEHDLIKSGYIK